VSETTFLPAYRALLRRTGIDLAGLETVRGAATPSCVIAHDASGAQVTFIDQGPMGDARAARIPERLLARCRWLHLGTGDPAYLMRLQRAARSRGLKVALDPAQEIHYRWDRATLTATLQGSELFFGNEAEAERARSLLGLRTVAQLTERVPVVVITRGARGARAFTRRGRVETPAVRVVKVADPTGAGDAFRGGFYAGWLGGQALEDCLSAGTRSAARWLAARHPPTRGIRP
jgi:sugar/nucleoside kinase (ribokinase family)